MPHLDYRGSGQGSDNPPSAEDQQERPDVADRRPESSEAIRRPSSSNPEEDEMVRHPRRRGGLEIVRPARVELRERLGITARAKFLVG